MRFSMHSKENRCAMVGQVDPGQAFHFEQSLYLRVENLRLQNDSVVVSAVNLSTGVLENLGKDLMVTPVGMRIQILWEKEGRELEISKRIEGRQAFQCPER